MPDVLMWAEVIVRRRHGRDIVDRTSKGEEQGIDLDTGAVRWMFTL